MKRGFIALLISSLVMALVFGWGLMLVIGPASSAILPFWASNFVALWLSMTLALAFDIGLTRPFIVKFKAWCHQEYNRKPGE